jgi:hypothetical protein
MVIYNIFGYIYTKSQYASNNYTKYHALTVQTYSSGILLKS